MAGDVLFGERLLVRSVLLDLLPAGLPVCTGLFCWPFIVQQVRFGLSVSFNEETVESRPVPATETAI